jgi:hypothetical protein
MTTVPKMQAMCAVQKGNQLVSLWRNKKNDNGAHVTLAVRSQFDWFCLHAQQARAERGWGTGDYDDDYDYG